jgi:pyruvate,orthophosphate dikinase
MVGAAAIVTRHGGVASHAAVVARSWAIPAVTGIGDMAVHTTGIQVADMFVAEGELVTVDGTHGALFHGDQRGEGTAEPPEVVTIRAWAAQLGIEPGAGAMAPDSAGRSADITLFELARTVQLKGLCSPQRAAAVLAAAEARVETLLQANDALFQSTPRGYMLTPDGRAWATGQLLSERASADVHALERSYQEFMALNHRFKQLVSEWQGATQTDLSGEPWATVVASLAAIHEELRPVANDNATQVPRLESYARRFALALDSMQRGDRSMLASPLKESYHTVWFEYHEELIALCGRDRASEES